MKAKIAPFILLFGALMCIPWNLFILYELGRFLWWLAV